MKRIICLFFSYCALLPLSAANHYVAVSGNDAQDGLSWATAVSTLQTAINAADKGDTVFVSAGIYQQSITLKDGVNVFGGYDVITGERNVDANLTILDGTTLKTPLVIATKASTIPVYVDGFILQKVGFLLAES